MGYSVGGFVALMDRYAVEPARVYVHGQRADKFWNPAVVLQVRAAHSLKKQLQREARAEREQQALALHRARSIRVSALEGQRNKRLSKIATARGTTVAKLRIDLGIDKA